MAVEPTLLKPVKVVLTTVPMKKDDLIAEEFSWDRTTALVGKVAQQETWTGSSC